MIYSHQTKHYLAFKRFNFGENFVKWVEVLSCINYMGWLSQSIEVSSGIRQGCPFSPMAFTLALELLAKKIRADPSVKGISIPRNHKCFLKLLLYADDITLFLQDRDDFKKCPFTSIIFFQILRASNEQK